MNWFSMSIANNSYQTSASQLGIGKDKTNKDPLVFPRQILGHHNGFSLIVYDIITISKHLSDALVLLW
jgi:hypothetical protein